MPNESLFPVNAEYDEYCGDWKQARDWVAGEKAVKDAGTEYLPKLDEMTNGEYKSYKERTKFFGATGRTLNGLIGMLFRRDPKKNLIGIELETFGKDVDLQGQTINEYANEIAKDVMAVGRGGTLIDFNLQEKRSYFAFYCAESICDWEVTRRFGKMMLTRLVLHEYVDDEAPAKIGDFDPNVENQKQKIEQLRVISLIGETEQALQCVIERWQMQETGSGKKKKSEWVKLPDILTVTRNGVALTFIPFVFHSSEISGECCCKPPLMDIISVNIHHYRISADYNHAIFFAGTPTAWVAGFPTESKLRIGSSVAWVSENVLAKAGYLEFTGQGIEPIRQALEDDKRDMAILGARLLEEQKRDSEATETVRIRQTGETSILSNIADNLSKTLTRAIKIAAWWVTLQAATPEDITDENASFAIQKDFIESKMDPAELTALTTTWLRGGISHDTYLDNLRKGEVLPDGITNDDERIRIEEGMPMLTSLIKAQQPPQPKPQPANK